MSEGIEIKEELLEIVENGVQEAQVPENVTNFTEWVFADEPNPGLRQLFHSFYNGAFQNRVGVAHVKNQVTGEMDTLLVGVHIEEDGNVKAFPLARILAEGEVNDYLTATDEAEDVGESAEG